MTTALAVYLRDHESAAGAGLDLLRRAIANQRDKPYAAELRRLEPEVQADREELRTLMRDLRISGDPLLSLALRLGERVARLKPNGRLLRRAPLSDLIEIEALLDAVHAKAVGWQALAARPGGLGSDVVDLEALQRRAEQQQETLRHIHRQVAAAVLDLA